MRITGSTDTGLVRKNNQDFFAYEILDESIGYAVVCDGMGGANGGNVASSAAVKAITESLKNNISSALDEDQLKAMLCDAVQEANEHVFTLSASDQNLNGMGTTVVACIINSTENAENKSSKLSTAYIAHAGDSRAYLINDLNITQITKDHTIVQNLVENGRLTADEAKDHPKKHIITRALGVESKLDIDLYEASLKDNDILIICTDGLTNHLDCDAILNIVKKFGFKQCAEKLIKAANEKGGSDNITVVAISN